MPAPGARKRTTRARASLARVRAAVPYLVETYNGKKWVRLGFATSNRKAYELRAKYLRSGGARPVRIRRR